MEFKETVSIEASLQRVWAFLWDVERMAKCIPGCETASVIEAGKRYQAVVAQKVGPFRVRLPLEIEIKAQTPPRALSVTATGQDVKVATNVTVALDLNLTEKSEVTDMVFTANVTILGKLAVLGYPIIKRKASQIIGQFAHNVKTQLEEGAGPATV